MLGLDIRTRRKEGKRGKFTALSLGASERKGAFVAEKSGAGTRDVDFGIESNPNPMAKGRGAQRGGQGYAVPDEQFAYDDDTSYHGAAGQIERRSLENRI